MGSDPRSIFTEHIFLFAFRTKTSVLQLCLMVISSFDIGHVESRKIMNKLSSFLMKKNGDWVLDFNGLAMQRFIKVKFVSMMVNFY